MEDNLSPLSKFKGMCLDVTQATGHANRWGWSEVIQTVTNCTPAWCMRPQSSGDYVPDPLDAEDCLAVINGPALCSRQFGSIRNWNALGLIRQTKPKYPLLVMRTLCHSLTPRPLWPCRKRARGKHLHFFPASRNSFFEWGEENEKQNERAINCQLHWEGWLRETMAYEKKKLFGDIWWEYAQCWMQPIFKITTLCQDCQWKERVVFFLHWIPSMHTCNYILDTSLYKKKRPRLGNNFNLLTV